MSDRTGEYLGWPGADAAFAQAIAARHAVLGRSVLVGLAGAQGSGKSTMAPRVALLLAETGLRTAILALDDFYLTLEERQALARKVHPLLATRGVPGTHDVPRLSRVIDGLLAGKSATIPRFEKSRDDRVGDSRIDGPVDVVLLEGWCIGARPQPSAALTLPVNRLERDEDPDGSWRRWVNERLARDYAALFDRLDLSVLLRAPSFAVVERWRGEQEAELGPRGMTPGEIGRFIQHYERITRAMLEEGATDCAIDLDARRVPLGWRVR